MQLIKCPQCDIETQYTGNEFRPFCSERCKMLDFGVWADGGYRLPIETASLSEEDLEKMEKALTQNRN